MATPTSRDRRTDTVGAAVALALGHRVPVAQDALVDTCVDTVAVTVAGHGTPAVRTLRRWLEPSLGESSVWGTGERLAASRAALVNGTAAHALDFDDAGLSMPIHPSAVLWPTVLALATPDTTTDRLLAAVEVGNVLIRALADLLPMETHYDRGWHATSTLGVLAATAAGAAVADLTEDQARYALGMAASTAAGSLANFGSMTKPLHAGRAASDAVAAVGLAGVGFTADASELDHPRGFLARYGAPDGTTDLGERIAHWTREWSADCAIKQFAACFGTHRALAATTRLRDDLGVPDVESVSRVLVEAHPATLRPLRTELPITGDEAKFSMAFNVAQVLRTGGVGPGDFTPGTIAANASLMERVTTVALPGPSTGEDLGGRRFARVAVTLTDGTTLDRTVTLDAEGDRPTAEAIDDKFVRCSCASGVPVALATTLPASLRSALSRPDLADLTELLGHTLIDQSLIEEYA